MGIFRATYDYFFGQTFRLTDVEPWKLYSKNVPYVAGGRAMTVEGAIALTVVFACMRLLSDTVAGLPVDVFERTGPGRREERPEHDVARLFSLRPNAWMTPLQFKRAMQLDLEGWGNAFARIVRGVRGNVVALEYLRASGMKLVLDDSGRPTRYEYTDERGRRSDYSLAEVLHLRGIGNGTWGLSPIAATRLAITAAANAEAWGSRQYAKGQRRAGFMKTDQVLKPEQRTQVRQAIIDPMHDPDNSIGLLEAGFDFTPISLTPEDAQYIETRKWMAVDLARIFGVPPHMVGELDRATFSNIEEQGINFATYTIAARVREWEEECRVKLFPASEQRTHFLKFNMNALMRANATARAGFYAVMVRNGIMSINEVRALEDLEPIEGGDEPRMQMQMQPVGTGGGAPPATPAGADRRATPRPGEAA